MTADDPDPAARLAALRAQHEAWLRTTYDGHNRRTYAGGDTTDLSKRRRRRAWVRRLARWVAEMSSRRVAV